MKRPVRMTMRWPSIACAALIWSFGCGPDVVERAEMLDVCGEPGPVRVLELPEGVQPLGIAGSVTRIGERVLWVVGENTFEPNPHHEGYDPPEQTTVWASGPCGETPVVVAQDVHAVVERDVWPGEPLACDPSTGDVLVLDPYGMRQAQVVFAAVGCDAEWTEHGVIAVAPRDTETSELVLHPYPASPWDPAPAPIVLLDDLRAEIHREPARGYGDTFEVLEHEILALTIDEDLVRIALPSGSVTVVQAGVAHFYASRDGRFVIWQDLEVFGDDPDFPIGHVSLLDRTTGSSAWIADSSVLYGNAYVHDGPPRHARITLGKFYGDPTRIVPLEGGATIDVPDRRYVGGPVGDGSRWLVTAYDESPFTDARYLLRTLDSGEEQLVHEGWCATFIDQDAIEFLDVSLWIDEWPFDQGPLTRVPLDTLEPELLAERMSRHRHDLGDGRIVTALDVQGHFLADLVVVDPETLGEELVDTEVFAYSTGYNATQIVEGAIAYAVSDGDRSGVWLARLAPP